MLHMVHLKQKCTFWGEGSVCKDAVFVKVDVQFNNVPHVLGAY
jgi:hypothetical protein